MYALRVINILICSNVILTANNAAPISWSTEREPSSRRIAANTAAVWASATSVEPRMVKRDVTDPPAKAKKGKTTKTQTETSLPPSKGYSVLDGKFLKVTRSRDQTKGTDPFPGVGPFVFVRATLPRGHIPHVTGVNPKTRKFVKTDVR